MAGFNRSLESGADGRGRVGTFSARRWQTDDGLRTVVKTHDIQPVATSSNMKPKPMPKPAANPTGKGAAVRVSIVEGDAPVRDIQKGWLVAADGFEFVSGFETAEESLTQLPLTQFVMHAVDTYIRRIYEKLHVRSRAQAVAKHVNFQPAKSEPAPSC